MMKKVLVVVLTILSLGSSLYLYAANLPLEEGRFGNTGVLLLSIPFTMILVNSNLLVLPKLINVQSSYSRYKKGIESIFLSISIILTLLHTGLLLLLIGKDVNLLLLVPVTVGIVLITTANTLPRFKLDNRKTPSTTLPQHDIWNIIIRPFALPLFLGGLVMILCVFLPGNLMLIGFFSILAITLFLSLFFSYRAYRASLYKA